MMLHKKQCLFEKKLFFYINEQSKIFFVKEISIMETGKKPFRILKGKTQVLEVFEIDSKLLWHCLALQSSFQKQASKKTCLSLNEICFWFSNHGSPNVCNEDNSRILSHFELNENTWNWCKPCRGTKCRSQKSDG